ncbi:MAG: flagellar M-ring protein FliF [Spirochaetales bacterium]|jgi:flagellar M-ring protein FliF|nr:flagellar M-ring protein FliF [Spirochaetales bacterium]
MNNFIKKIIEKIKTLWGKWSLMQKIIFFAVVAAVIGGIVLLSVFSSTPNMVALLSSPISDPEALSKISFRLDQEKVEHQVTSDGRILVSDRLTSQRMIALLVREDLIPTGTSPWDIFKMDRWTITDFERDIQLRQALTRNLKQHIEALEDVDSAQVTLVMPEKALFTEDQDPVSVSIILTPRPGSDITTNPQKIQGVERLVQFAVQGLQNTNIVILDNYSNHINNLDGMEDFTQVSLAAKQLKQKRELEAQLKREILEGLAGIFTADRVRLIRVDVDLDHSQRSSATTEFFPISIRKDNPDTPYDETETINNVLRSQNRADEHYRGTGFHPQGPPGMEGQIPPGYLDQDNIAGTYDNTSVIDNFEVNQENRTEQKRPWEIKKITIGIAVDGVWNHVYTEKGQKELSPTGSIVREYVPVSDEELLNARRVVESSIGYDSNRGDSVEIRHMSFDRRLQFEQEDQIFRNRQRTARIALYSALGLLAIGIIAVAVRLIIKEQERRKRLREEELARQHAAMREAALRQAEEESVDINISVEEKARMEMQEAAKNMAREHPEDVAMLIRTWLAEE